MVVSGKGNKNYLEDSASRAVTNAPASQASDVQSSVVSDAS